MTSRALLFKCEAVSPAAPKFIMDEILGELQISAVPPKLEPPQTEPIIVDDPELGPLVVGPAPAMRALLHRTGPPPCRFAKTAGGR